MNELPDHLFRHEAGRMLASLLRIFGLNNLPLAEDVVQDVFSRALEVWRVEGLPRNPGAWLMTAAHNRALDIVRREGKAHAFAPELGRLLESELARGPADEAASDAPIRDEQLRMMFSCCHPDLTEEAQVALILNVLCGFAAPEIAAAFLASRAAVEKRIARGKKALAGARRLFDLDREDFEARLSTVHRALYLLFNEGYHGAAEASRGELCQEAIRLAALLLEHPPSAVPSTCALSALMCFQAARLHAREDEAGELTMLIDHDRSTWDGPLLAQGFELLRNSAAGHFLSRYHLEAAIAAQHAAARDLASTDWPVIVSLYDRLLDLEPSPAAELARAIAVGQRDGPEAGIAAVAAIADRERLEPYPFLPAALGELELRRGDRVAARAHLTRARELARNPQERSFFARRLLAL